MTDKKRIKKFIGEVTEETWPGHLHHHFYAICVEGVDPKFVHMPWGRQMEALKQIEDWKQDAKVDWISTKNGKKPGPQFKKWLSGVAPKEFYIRWNLKDHDDSREVYYK